MNLMAVTLLAVATMPLLGSVTSAAERARIKRPMQLHRVAELNVEIWTELDPQWETRLEFRNGQPVFSAETPALTYPPAGMTWSSVRGVTFTAAELPEAARGAIEQAARNYGVNEMASSVALRTAKYGELTGYEARFSATAHGQPVDVLVFFGHRAGRPPVLAHAYTLQGKLDHISEHVRRSWQNLRYLQ